MAELKNYTDFLQSLVNTNRINLLEQKLNLRTKYLTIVLEDLYQPHNASAVIRSADSFGIQDIHVIENKNKFEHNAEISVGSEYWVNIEKYNNSPAAIEALRINGYRIVATSLHPKSTSLESFNISKGKTALVFGTELTGISNTIMENADEFLHIPMVGFAQSLNISVCAAITMHHLTWKLRQSDINWQLTEKEKEPIRVKWLENSVKKPNTIRKWFIERYGDIDF